MTTWLSTVARIKLKIASSRMAYHEIDIVDTCVDAERFDVRDW